MVDITYLQALNKSKARIQNFANYGLSLFLTGSLVISLFIDSPALLTLRVVLLWVDLIMAVLAMFAYSYMEETIKTESKKKDFSTLIMLVTHYTVFRNHPLLSSGYLFLSNLIVIIAMIATGWVFQTVIYIFAVVLMQYYFFNLLNDLPSIINKLHINEGDL